MNEPERILYNTTRSNTPFGCFRSCRTKTEPTRVGDLITKEELINDVKVRSYHKVFKTPEQYVKDHPYDTERFSLEDMQSAGVNLKEIPCGHMLDGRDELSSEITAEQAIELINNNNNNNNNE